MTDAILTLESVSKTFRKSRWATPVKALREISLSIHEGDSLAIVGESGCGKTTLARVMALMTPPDSGSVKIDGVCVTTKVTKRRPFHETVQMVVQDHDAAFNPFWRFKHVLNAPLRALRPPVRDARVRKVLEDVGLDQGILGRYPDEVSGGQRQRLNIARALAVQPRLVIADEPTAALDASIQARVVNLFAQLRESHRLTLVVITHNLATVPYMCDDIAVMYRGRLIETGPSRIVLQTPLHPYTRLLRDSAPGRGREKLDFKEKDRNVADIVLHGCDFYPRCPRAQEVCRAVSPKLEEKTGHMGRRVACFFPLETSCTSSKS